MGEERRSDRPASRSLEDLNAAQLESETDSFTPHRYRQMATHLPGSAPRILDVGCNTGRGGAVLRELIPAARLEGVEMLAHRIERIPSGIYEAIHSCQLEELPGHGEFDALVMGELIEHIPFDFIESFLLSAWRLLRPGGVLVLTTPNPHYIRLRLRRGTVLGGSHVSVHCAAALRQYLQYLDFDRVTVRGTGRVSSLLGTRFPLALYGSYLITTRRPS